MIGKICRCSLGRPGIVLGRRRMPWGESWTGIGLDNGNLWLSREPVEMNPEEVNSLQDSKFLKTGFSADPTPQEDSNSTP